MNQNNQGSGQNSGKYKTMLCRHFETTKGCMHKDKCQFAHGTDDLRSSNNKVLNIYHTKVRRNGCLQQQQLQ